MSRWLACTCLVLSFACGDDGGGTADGSPGSLDSGAATDASNEIDAAPGTVDASLADAMPGSDFGPVDCVTTSDCLSPTTCNQSAPGGICNGCGNESQCGADFTCFVGACVRDCTVDDDCSAGKRCTPGTGRCVLRSCAVSACPAPYTCGDTNFCERPVCGSNNSCTMGFSCDTASQICMEP